MPGDPLEGASGMLRSLCVQVLLAFPDPNLLVLEFPNRSKLKAIERFQIEALCELFRSLLILVSEKIGHFVFFAMIDEVSHLEQDGHIVHLMTVLDYLFALTNELQGVTVTLKILLTSQSASMFMSRWVGEADIITMSDSVFDNGYGCSDIRMTMEGLDTFDIDY